MDKQQDRLAECIKTLWGIYSPAIELKALHFGDVPGGDWGSFQHKRSLGGAEVIITNRTDAKHQLWIALHEVAHSIQNLDVPDAEKRANEWAGTRWNVWCSPVLDYVENGNDARFKELVNGIRCAQRGGYKFDWTA